MKLCERCGTWHLKEVPKVCSCGAKLDAPGKVAPPEGPMAIGRVHAFAEDAGLFNDGASGTVHTQPFREEETS